MTPPTPATLIIGYGNPLRGDDGVGWHVAQHLAAMMPATVACVRACHQLTPDLAESVSQVRQVIFIDADAQCRDADTALPELEPWRVRCQHVEPDWSAAISGCSHHLVPAVLMLYAAVLYGAFPKALVLTVTGVSFAYTQALSPAVEAVLPVLVDQLQMLVQSRDSDMPCF